MIMMADAPDMDQPDWDVSKENFQPRKNGRSGAALKDNTDDLKSAVVEAQRRCEHPLHPVVHTPSSMLCRRDVVLPSVGPCLHDGGLPGQGHPADVIAKPPPAHPWQAVLAADCRRHQPGSPGCLARVGAGAFVVWAGTDAGAGSATRISRQHATPPALIGVHRCPAQQRLMFSTPCTDPFPGRFVQWTQATFTSGGAQSQLVPLLERCTSTFQSDARYKEDLRYLKIWILYVRGCW